VLIALTITTFPFLKAMPAISLHERAPPRRAQPPPSQWLSELLAQRQPYAPSMRRTKDKRCRSGCAMCAMGGRKELI
jgi:hypothetical protein